MTDDRGPKETMEILGLVLTLAKLITKEVKGDGLQWSDAFKIITSPEFQVKMAEAVEGISQIPGEVKALSATQGLDIAGYLIKGTKELLDDLEAAA